MTIDVSKLCSDFLRQSFPDTKVKATHARELVAAFFGYKSHAALLAEQEYPLFKLEEAELLVPSMGMMENRRSQLDGLPPDLPSSRDLAERLSSFLKREKIFNGEIWLYPSLETYVMEDYLVKNEHILYDELSGVMAETNACFDDAHYETATITEEAGALLVAIDGALYGSNDGERPFCGDQIDMRVTITLSRVAGKTGFMSPEIEAAGTVNDDWVDPEIRFGVSAPE